MCFQRRRTTPCGASSGNPWRRPFRPTTCGEGSASRVGLSSADALAMLLPQGPHHTCLFKGASSWGGHLCGFRRQCHMCAVHVVSRLWDSLQASSESWCGACHLACRPGSGALLACLKGPSSDWVSTHVLLRAGGTMIMLWLW